MGRSASPNLAVLGRRPHLVTMKEPLASGHPNRNLAGVFPRFHWDALQVALAILVLLQVWRVHELFPSLAISGLPILLTLAVLLLFWLNRDPRRRLTSLNGPVIYAALGILVLVALSVPGSLYPGMSLNFLFKDYLRSVILMFLVAASVRGLADLRRIAWLQVAGATLFSAAVVARAEMGSDGRLRSMAYYDVNDLAMLIVCTLPLVLYLWRRPARGPGRVVLIAATVFLMMTLGKTGSRGGFLGFLTVGGYLLLRLRGISRIQRVGTVVLLVILFVGLANDAYFDRIQTILHPSTDYNWSGKSETGRIEIWKRGVGYMLSHPVLGVGASAFEVAEGTLAPEARQSRQYGRGFKWSAAHNSFIQIGAETGVLGLILFVALLTSAVRVLSRVRRRSVGEGQVLGQILTACLVGFVVPAFFLSQGYSAYLYTLLGMIVGLAKIVSPAIPPRVPMSAVLRPPGPVPTARTLVLPHFGGPARDGR